MEDADGPKLEGELIGDTDELKGQSDLKVPEDQDGTKNKKENNFQWMWKFPQNKMFNP